MPGSVRAAAFCAPGATMACSPFKLRHGGAGRFMLTLETRQPRPDTPTQTPSAAVRQSPQNQRFLSSLGRSAPEAASTDRLTDQDYRTVMRWVPLVDPGIALTLVACTLMVLSDL